MQLKNIFGFLQEKHSLFFFLISVFHSKYLSIILMCRIVCIIVLFVLFFYPKKALYFLLDVSGTLNGYWKNSLCRYCDCVWLCF